VLYMKRKVASSTPPIDLPDGTHRLEARTHEQKGPSSRVKMAACLR
jgi:hypothetical protein